MAPKCAKKQASKRPKGVVFWTHLDVEAWIAENARVVHVPMKSGKKIAVEQPEDPIDRAIWWVAYREAQGFLESARTKDVAMLFRDGVRKAGPRYVDDWVQSIHRSHVEDAEGITTLGLENVHRAADLQIEADLLKFFRDGV